MIPRNLIPIGEPFQEFPRWRVNHDNLTWLEYIVGYFDGIHWYESCWTDTSDINIMLFQPRPFPEKLNQHHLQFFQTAVEEGYIDTQEDGKPHFYPDTFCRFDLWTLYNYPNGDVELDCGGTMRIEALPQQNEIDDVPSLNDPVPYDMPLIFGPLLSLSDRPFDR